MFLLKMCILFSQFAIHVNILIRKYFCSINPFEMKSGPLWDNGNLVFLRKQYFLSVFIEESKNYIEAIHNEP